MPYPSERRTIVIKQEAARRRFLTICERCFPEWTKRLTSEKLVELTTHFLQDMPQDICWLERSDGLKMGGQYPADAYQSQAIVDAGQPPPDAQSQELPERKTRHSTPLYTLVAVDVLSQLPRVMCKAETILKAANWLPSLLNTQDDSVCRFLAEIEDANWIMTVLRKKRE